MNICVICISSYIFYYSAFLMPLFCSGLFEVNADMHLFATFNIFLYNILRNVIGRTQLKVKNSRNRPGVAQRVPGDLGSQIS